MSDLYARLVEAAHLGMTPSVWAKEKPDAVAIHDPIQTRTFAEVNANANRIVRVLRAAGLKAGDGVAVLTSNRAEFVEALSACLRGGFRFTPVNWHLTADEVEYIINDCEAKALVAETRYRLGSVGQGSRPGPEALGRRGRRGLHALCAKAMAAWTAPISPIRRSEPRCSTPRAPRGGPRACSARGRCSPSPEPGAPDDVQLCAGPAYHAAPLAFDIRIPMSSGIPIVFLDKWDSEGVLATIERYRITRAHLVPIMFQRLLGLPDEVKAEVRPLEPALHRPRRRALPAGGEAGDDRLARTDPQRILRRLRGRRGLRGELATSGCRSRARSVACPRPAPPRSWTTRARRSWSRASRARSTSSSRRSARSNTTRIRPRPPPRTRAAISPWATSATSTRTATCSSPAARPRCIISGGVNIYPQEIDNEIIKHEAVEDSCVIGVPSEEWGEAVKAVVTLNPGHQPSDALAADILAFTKARLAGYKAPRSWTSWRNCRGAQRGRSSAARSARRTGRGGRGRSDRAARYTAASIRRNSGFLAEIVETSGVISGADQ